MLLTGIVQGKSSQGSSRAAGAEAGARVMIQINQFDLIFGLVIEPPQKVTNKNRYLVLTGIDINYILYTICIYYIL